MAKSSAAQSAPVWPPEMMRLRVTVEDAREAHETAQVKHGDKVEGAARSGEDRCEGGLSAPVKE